ncbi:MAG: type II secretion system F family protein [Solirubrobacteraceae bacterium]
MTRAELLAALAAVVLAAAIVELAAAASTGTRGRSRLPARAAGALAGAGRLLGASVAAPPGLRAQLDAAGVGAGVGDILAARWGAATAGVLGAAGPATVMPGRLALTLLATAAAAGYLLPGWWLRGRLRRRRGAMTAELAVVLDLVAVAADAGLTPMRALAEVGRRGRGALATELRATATRAALGAPHAEALAPLSARCPVEGIDALVGAVARAERHGAPLAPGVRALAVDAQARAAQRLRDRAARAAPKIQLVVALLLVPAVMLLVAAALASRL